MSKLEKPAQIVPVFYVIDVFADTAGAVSLQKIILRQPHLLLCGFLDDHEAIHQVGFHQLAFNGHLPVHQVG